MRTQGQNIRENRIAHAQDILQHRDNVE